MRPELAGTVTECQVVPTTNSIFFSTSRSRSMVVGTPGRLHPRARPHATERNFEPWLATPIVDMSLDSGAKLGSSRTHNGTHVINMTPINMRLQMLMGNSSIERESTRWIRNSGLADALKLVIEAIGIRPV